MNTTTTETISANDSIVVAHFAAQGIAANPRVDVLTFHKWLEAGRCVSKGQKGLRLGIFIETIDKNGAPKKIPKSVSVFHISQTEPCDPTAPRKERKPRPPTDPTPTPSEPAYSGASERYASKLRALADTLRRNAEPEFSKSRETNTRRRMQIAQGILQQAQNDIDRASFYEYLADNATAAIAAHIGASSEELRTTYGIFQNLQHGRIATDQSDPKHCLLMQHKPTGAKSMEAKILEAKSEAVGCGVDFFATKPELANRMVALAGLRDHDEILEPSCGTGHIINAIAKAHPKASVYGVELSERLANVARLTNPKASIETGDFLTKEYDFLFDNICANPPFSNDKAHIKKMWSMLRSGGRLVTVCGAGSLMRSKSSNTEFLLWLEEIGATLEPIEGQAFEGTSAQANLIIAVKE